MPFTASPRIWYETAGPDHGPRVLLVMGLAMRGLVWGPQIEGLKERYRLAWFDARGLGDSERAGPRWNMDVMARDAEHVLDTLGWESEVHLVGVSMGGMVAQHLALRRPTRFTTLTLIATSAGGSAFAKLPPLPGLARLLKAIPSFRRRTSEVLADLLYPREFVASLDPAAFRQRMKMQMGKPAAGRTLRAQLRALMGHDVRERLPAIRLPTLVVRPGRDLLVHPRQSDLLAAAIPEARLLDLPDAGHGVIFQCARQVNEALVDHFERHGAND